MTEQEEAIFIFLFVISFIVGFVLANIFIF